MRVGYILPGFCANEQDWCIPVLTNFLREMSGHAEVTVYAPHYPFHKGQYTVHGIPVHCFSNTKPQGIQRLQLWRTVLQQLAADHAQRPFDLLHAFWATETGFLATKAGTQLRIPTVVSIAGGEFARFPEQNYGSQLYRHHRFMIRRSLRKATAITCGSAWLTNRVPLPARNLIQTLPLGVDMGMMAPGPVRSGTRLLSSASLIPLKDYPTMLHAVAIAQRTIPDITLDCCGYQDTVELPRLQRLVEELGLRSNVRFVGNVSHEQMPELYWSHDLLLHSSLYESQGMAILEALATGMPVVASDVGIAASLPHSLVYRFPPGNPQAMAECILRSLATNGHAHQAHANGSELIERVFSYTTVGNQFRALYRQLMP